MVGWVHLVVYDGWLMVHSCSCSQLSMVYVYNGLLMVHSCYNGLIDVHSLIVVSDGFIVAS